MQILSLKIWTWVAKSTSYRNNRYAMSATIYELSM